MARSKSDFLKAFGKASEVFKKIVDGVLELGGGDEDLARLLTDADRVRRICEIIVERSKTEERLEYFTPVLDHDVPERYAATLAKYRQLAREHDVADTTPVCYRVRAGFTLKKHVPKAGPCYENFQYLQGWNFPDEATSDCLVFWVPRALSGSTCRTRREQVELLSSLRAKLELPAHHMSGFGKAALLAGLVLAHFKATGERIPLDRFWVRTDTCNADGGRLNLGSFDGIGLLCSGGGFDDVADVNLGVFALGVEELGS
ncbi:MAG: hypothetical protein WC730_01095 [Patescibacteria group bacterium]|jgi:hypothetical protein